MDSRYLISNCKDQSIKLWDMRRFSSEATIQRSRIISNHVNRVWDYRTGSGPGTCKKRISRSDIFYLIDFQSKHIGLSAIQVFVLIVVITLAIH
jgi:hypothetical protein